MVNLQKFVILLNMNRKKMRLYSLIILALSCITALLFMTCDNEIEFTRITLGKTWMGKPSDSSYYFEDILVRNISRNKPYDVGQSKMMIAYYDSVGLSIDELLKMPEIKHYWMYFCISTYATRRYFIEKKGDTYDGNETGLGYIYIGRCKEDSTKWKITIGRNLGTADDFDKVGGNSTSEFLQNEYDSGWYEANKDNELVKYYMGLRGKKSPPPKGEAK